MHCPGEDASAKASIMVCRKGKSSYMSSYMHHSYLDSSDSDEDRTEEDVDAKEEGVDAEEAVMEAQWKSYVDKLRQSGELSSCLAVADVSGSMHGEPMQVYSSSLHARKYHHYFLCTTRLLLFPAIQESSACLPIPLPSPFV